jgi:Domain of unknown function (DUF4386)
MSATYALPSQLTEESPQAMARMTGVLWLACILTSLVGAVIATPMIAPGNAAATATNVLANESLFRLGSVANLLSDISYLGVTVLLYYVMKPVSQSLSLTAASLGLTGVALGAVAAIAPFVPFSLLRGGHFTAFTPGQLQEMAAFAIRLQMDVFFSVGVIFFGVQCFIVGHLIRRSTFRPRPLGALLALAGAIYVIVACSNLLAPRLIPNIMAFVGPAALLGEGSLTMWLLVRGINVQRWKELASAR